MLALRRAWGRSGWARLGRIADALERMDARQQAADVERLEQPEPPDPPEPPDQAPAQTAPGPPVELDRWGVGVWRRMGLNLLLDGGSTLDRWLIEGGSWELAQITKLRELVLTTMPERRRPRVFIDIGAYFGLYALFFDRERLFDRIIAFEPDRMNFAQLQSQLFLNGASYRIEARNAAVGATATTGHMQRADRQPEGIRAGVGLWSSGDARCVSVPVVAIDDELDIEGGLVVAKIDVEGRQNAVLKGMRRTIERNACIMQIEAYENARPATVTLLGELGLSIAGEIDPDLYAIRTLA